MRTATPDATDRLAAIFGVARREAEYPQWWLLERTGSHRYVYGPYALNQAVAEKGSRYNIVRGTGLRNGTTMTPGDVVAAVSSYRIWPADPDVRSLS